MLDQRPRVEEERRAVFRREDFGIRRITQDHAAGKWFLRYPTASGQGGRTNIASRTVPLYPLNCTDSRTVTLRFVLTRNQATCLPVPVTSSFQESTGLST